MVADIFKIYLWLHIIRPRPCSIRKPTAARRRLWRGGNRAFLNRRATGGRDEAAEFIAQMVGDLLAVAQRHRLETLAFLLDMAKMEAEELVRAAALGRQALSPARRRG